MTLTEPLDRETLQHFHGAQLGDAADIVAPEVEQHQVLGPLLGVGEKLRLQAGILGRVGVAGACAGQRPDRHQPVAQTDEDFRAAADDREAAEIEEEQEGRGLIRRSAR